MAGMFNVGDTVRLKSGGPKMTVESVTPDDGKTYVYCKWFDEKNEIKNAEFDENTLESF